MNRRPTILDVAKKAGVSKSTVSLVLQDSKTVKETTRKAVRDAMVEIGYVYNRSAATLRSASSGLIGLVINDLRNPFFTEFAASLQMTLADNGYATVIANTDEDSNLQSRMIASLVEHGVSGLIISPAYGCEDETKNAISAASTPTIQVLRRIGSNTDSIPFVAPDYMHGSTIATQHLLDLGCKRVAFVGGLNGRPVTQERMSGYLFVLKDQGMEPLIYTGEATRRFGRTIVERIGKEHPEIDGILCFNDLVALGVLSACAEFGPRVGKDIRVIGIDDIEACRDSFPTLTSVSCDIPGLADFTAKSMLKWISEGVKPEPVTRTPVTLAQRSSSKA